LFFGDQERSFSEKEFLPKPGITSSTLMGSSEDCLTNPGAFSTSDSRLASAVSGGSSMVLKKSSTLTAEADDLAEIAVPAAAVAVPDVEA